MIDQAAPITIDDDQPWSPPSPSVASRRPSARSRGSARVTVVSPDRREVLTESDTEAKAAYALLAHPEVKGLREQPQAVRYVDGDGVPHLHTFDFITLHGDGTRTAVVVRPKGSADRHELAALVETFARTLSRSVADRFVLLTEQELDPDRVCDGKLINAARLHPRPDHDEIVAENARRANGPVTVATLMGLAGLGGAGFRSVARLIGAGVLARLDGGRLTHGSRVTITDRVGGESE